MHKFKFQPPREPRRSFQPPPRHDHISIINTLDKCTQILREDRLWLRNQIKNNSFEVLSIFKAYPKATQLQHLQIKLRKYLQGVKSRIKQEQLAKFRETLQHQTQLTHTQTLPFRKMHENKSVKVEDKSQERIDRGWRRYEERDIKGSHSRQHLKSDSSCELSQTAQFKPNKSVEQKKSSQMVMNSSLKHFQELLKYKCSHQVIEERQSQNVTSARLARQEENARPLQELSYSSQLNQYNWHQGRKEQDNAKLSSWDFEKKAKQVLYQEQQHSRISHKEEVQQMEESIMDKHFVDDSQQASPRPLSSLPNGQFKNHTFSNQSFQEQSSFQHHFSLSSNNATLSLATTQKLQDSRPDSDRNEENLFTPLQLLNQCRNFLKSREHSIKKDIETKEKQENEQCLFTRNHYKEVQLSDSMRQNQGKSEKKEEEHEVPEKQQEAEEKVEEEEEEESEDLTIKEKQEESGFTFPQVNNSQEKVESFSSPKEEKVLYTQFETFANSTLKSPFQKALSPPQILRPEPTIPKNLSIEDFLEELMEDTEMSPFISTEQFSTFIASNSQRQVFTHVFSSILSKEAARDICITGLAQQLNEAYNKAHGKYPHNDSVINGVYDLLDMDQKGHITREDVESFLSQIQEAEVTNFQEVSEEVIRLFEGSDFSNEQRITYWHLYLVRKNSEEFQSVRQLLNQFQFEIERE